MSETAETRDRRRFPRAAFQRPVAVRSGQRSFTAQLHEISEGGLRLETAEPIQDEITVQVPLRGRFGRLDHCDLQGKVVGREAQMVQIRFGRLLPRHQLQLRDFVWRANYRGF